MKEKSPTTANIAGIRKLQCALIEQAAKDILLKGQLGYKGGKKSPFIREQAWEFVNDPIFDDICDGLDMDADNIRRKLKTDQLRMKNCLHNQKCRQAKREKSAK